MTTPTPTDLPEALDRSAAVNLARNMLNQHECKGITPNGVRVLSEAVMAMDAALSAAAPAAPVELLEIAKRLALATDEGDDLAQGTHYIDKQGLIRCKGSFLSLIEEARAAIGAAAPTAPQEGAPAESGLPMGQEPKYTVTGTHIVNRHSGEAVPHDEPVFVFRARDALGVRALEAYLALIGEREPASQHADAVRGRIADFQRFAAAHPDRMKWPDTAAQPQAGAESYPPSNAVEAFKQAFMADKNASLNDSIAAGLAAALRARGAVPSGQPDAAYAERLIEALYENGDPISVDAAEEMQRMLAARAGAQAVPSDAEINAMAEQYLLRMFGSRVVFNGVMIDFARAVLAKWSAPAAVSAPSGIDALLEAIHKLPRYSFSLDSRNNLRRCEEKNGNWLELEMVHALFYATAAVAPGPGVERDAALWREHIGKLDTLVEYCPTCCQGFNAKPEMTRDEVIFECGKTSGRGEFAVVKRALQIACDHIEMDALRVSHCKDAAAIDAAMLAAAPQASAGEGIE